MSTRHHKPEKVTGLIAGSGGASSANIVWGADKLRDKGIRRVGPYQVPRTMSSTVSACLATPFGIHGLNYSITSACVTSTHCAAGMPVLMESKENPNLNTVMSNNFGFGGTNASIVLQRYRMG